MLKSTQTHPKQAISILTTYNMMILMMDLCKTHEGE